MEFEFYKPERTISGPAYGPWFKLFSSVMTLGLFVYGIAIATRYPIDELGFGVKLLLLGAALMLLLSCYWFLRSTVTIDENGITQTWLVNRHVAWHEVRGAKMVGIPFLGWLFPPRLLLRTGPSFVTFTGGNRELLLEFARIAIAHQLRP